MTTEEKYQSICSEDVYYDHFFVEYIEVIKSRMQLIVLDIENQTQVDGAFCVSLANYRALASLYDDQPDYVHQYIHDAAVEFIWYELHTDPRRFPYLTRADVPQVPPSLTSWA